MNLNIIILFLIAMPACTLADEQVQVDQQDRLGNLQKAFVQVFAVVVLAFLLGSSKAIDAKSTAKAVGSTYANVILPCAMFSAMATEKLGSINWLLIISIIVGSLITSLPLLIAIFVFSGSNKEICMRRSALSLVLMTDYSAPIGLTVLRALFPKLWHYLLLVDVITTTLVLGPIIIPLLEASKIDHDSDAGWKQKIKTTVLGVFHSPLVFMSLAGIFVNVVFGGHLHPFIEGTLDSIGDALQFCALFSLGLTLVGKASLLLGRQMSWSLALALFSTILRAIIMITFAALLGMNKEAKEFAFIFGVHPPSPFAFALALGYGDAEMMAGAIVIATVLSLPLIYFSMTLLLSQQLENLVVTLNLQADMLLTVSLLTVFIIIVLGIVVADRRKFPETFLTYAAAVQFLYAATRLGCNHTSGMLRTFIIYLTNLSGFACPLIIFVMGFNVYRLLTHGMQSSRAFRPYYYGAVILIPFLSLILSPINARSDVPAAFGCAYVYNQISLVICCVFWFLLLIGIIITSVQLERLAKRLPGGIPPRISEVTVPVTDPATGYSALCEDHKYIQLAGKWRVNDRFRYQILLSFTAIDLVWSIVGAIITFTLQDPNGLQFPSQTSTTLLLFSAFSGEIQGLVLFCAFGMRPDALNIYKRISHILMKTSGLSKLKYKAIALRTPSHKSKTTIVQPAIMDPCDSSSEEEEEEESNRNSVALNDVANVQIPIDAPPSTPFLESQDE